MRPSPLMQPLPREFAHPKQAIASLAANLITAASLLIILAILLAAWMLRG